MAKRLFPHKEEYKGFIIVLNSLDWDEMFKIFKDGIFYEEFSNRNDAIEWIDKKVNSKDGVE